jgi:serine protease inhibitor
VARLTQPEPFHLANGTSVAVPTMRELLHLGYAKEEGLTIVALDYLGGGLRFLIILPPASQSVDDVAARLKPEQLMRWTDLGVKSAPQSVELYLPKFRATGLTLSLGQALRAIGVKAAFDDPPGSANFDRIAPRQGSDYLTISEVFHQTFIALDEAGTEAAAATAVAMLATGARDPQQPVEVRVDRPFLFAIQHRASGACLFLGRITDPR